MKKKLCVLICLILAFSTATGCTTYNNFKNAFFSDEKAASNKAVERTIKIGVYEPLTGEYRTQGNEEKIGIELAHELYPEAAGKKVELIYADNQSDMYVAETVIQELVSQKPAVILGSYGETVTLVAGDAVKANNIPAISISSTNPLITVNNQYYFCAAFPESKQGDSLADFAYESQKISKVATVKVSGDDVATATVKRFTNRIKKITENNNSVVGDFEIDAASTDYSGVLDEIKKCKAKAVFLSVSPAVAQEFLKQAEEQKVTDVLYLGKKDWNDEKFLNFVKGSKKLKIAYTTDFSADAEKTEAAEEFIEAYKNKYGQDEEPTEAMAVAFDAYKMAIQAIDSANETTNKQNKEDVTKDLETDAAAKGAIEEWENAQDTGIPTGKAIRDALSNLNDFDGVSGRVSYEGTNEASKSVVINCIFDGKVQEAYIIE